MRHEHRRIVMNNEIDPQAASAPIPGEEGVSTAEAGEKEIDLNHLFPEEDTDLNSLFPDEDIKRLLKSISRNKKDLHTIKDRISEENAAGEEAEDDGAE
jgi:hypothetical protein